MKKALPFLDGPTFRSRLLVDCDGTPRPLAEVVDPWQDADFRALDPGFDRCMGRDTGPVIQRAYLERGRGHSKTSDIATHVTRALFCAQHPIRGVVAASDRDQARLVLNAIETLTRLNAPLRAALEIQSQRVVNRNTGSELIVISSDADSSYGILVSYIVLDELTHWGDSGEQLWESLISSAAKKATAMLCVISNAGRGMGNSWTWRVREACRNDPRFYFNALSGPRASWVSPENLEELRRQLTPSAYNRLVLNLWQSGLGDMLTAEMIEAAIDLTTPGDERRQVQYFGGIDLAVKKDDSALVIVGVDLDQPRPYQVVSVQSWTPRPGHDVDLSQVYRAVLQAAWEFPGIFLGADPSQALMIIQRARLEGVHINEMPFVGRNLNDMATALYSCFSDRLIRMPRHAKLIGELGRLNLVQKSFGLKIEAPRTSEGHCDSAIALSIALKLATEYVGSYVDAPEYDLPTSILDMGLLRKFGIGY